MVEGQFPKVDGEILYASEVNDFYNSTEFIYDDFEVYTNPSGLEVNWTRNGEDANNVISLTGSQLDKKTRLSGDTTSVNMSLYSSGNTNSLDFSTFNGSYGIVNTRVDFTETGGDGNFVVGITDGTNFSGLISNNNDGAFKITDNVKIVVDLNNDIAAGFKNGSASGFGPIDISGFTNKYLYYLANKGTATSYVLDVTNVSYFDRNGVLV